MSDSLPRRIFGLALAFANATVIMQFPDPHHPIAYLTGFVAGVAFMLTAWPAPRR